MRQYKLPGVRSKTRVVYRPRLKRKGQTERGGISAGGKGKVHRYYRTKNKLGGGRNLQEDVETEGESLGQGARVRLRRWGGSVRAVWKRNVRGQAKGGVRAGARSFP